MANRLLLGVGLVGAIGGCVEGGGPVVVTVNMADADLVAARDGDGAWQQLVADENGVAQLEVTSGRYGLTILCGTPSPTFAYFRSTTYFSTEADEYTSSCLAAPGQSATLTGTTAPGALIYRDYTEWMADGAGSYTAFGAAGVDDVVAFLPGAPARVLIEHGVEIMTDRTLDLPVATAGLEMPLVTPTVIGPGGPVTVYWDMATEHGTYVYFGSDAATIAVPPLAALAPTDKAAIGAHSGGCVAQVPVSAGTPTLAIRSASIEVDRDTASWTAADDDWEGVTLILRRPFDPQVPERASVTIASYATEAWMTEVGERTMPVVDPTTLPGWESGMTTFTTGEVFDFEAGIWRGDFSGDHDACWSSGTLTW